MSIHNFTLDRNLFNSELYSRITNLWFEDVPESAPGAPLSAMKKWYGAGSEEQKAALDAACATHAGDALESIAPNKLKLPPFKSHQDEEKNAQVLSGPLIDEIKQAQRKSEKEGADTLLALMLLLDQMPRNIFRDQASLPKVYQHYDRLALATLRSSMLLTPNPLDCSEYSHRPVVHMWLLMPLIHSEDYSAHELWQRMTRSTEAKMKAAGDNDTVGWMKGSFDAAEKHDDPLRRFGRYPHRNQALGRQNTPDEEEFMKTADTFGVKQHPKADDATKDEL